MNGRQIKKHLAKSLHITIKGKRYYTYAVEIDGKTVVGFTATPKQDNCAAYSFEEIKDTRFYCGKNASSMFNISLVIKDNMI